MMHPQIEQLARECNLDRIGYSDVNIEEFAHRLISQCNEVILDKVVRDYTTDPWENGYNSGLILAVDLVTNYFGVAECTGNRP